MRRQFQPVPQSMAEPAASQNTFSFVQMERRILELWASSNVFHRSMEVRKGKKPYIFYDGPPFATGLPHHGHIVASTIKDIVPRYWTMKGRHVLRRFGWDCHGLPIEHEIDKRLGMSAKQAVAELGVRKTVDLPDPGQLVQRGLMFVPCRSVQHGFEKHR